MSNLYQIRADFNKNSIIVYQAYASNIAEPALKKQRFVTPFSFNRMTWLKPSFLWLMHRSNWGQKKGQEKILGVKISRQGWDEALSRGILTHPNLNLYLSYENWKKKFDNAHVHIQWDPERAINGVAKNYYTIQVGISRFLIDDFVNKWIISITDYTPLTHKIYKLLRSGKSLEAKKKLPKEQLYRV